jgi:hypothetical protein
MVTRNLILTATQWTTTCGPWQWQIGMAVGSDKKNMGR